MSDAQTQSKLWKPAAIGTALLAAANFVQPAYDMYSKFTSPDDWGRVKSMEFARQQQKLQQKNLVCSLNMQRSMVRVDTANLQYGVCENADVLVTVYPDDKPAYQQWLSPENFVDEAKVASLIGAAYAATLPMPPLAGAGTAAPIPVQMQIKTLCQSWVDKARQTKLLRVTNEGGKCFRERINVVSGRVEVRENVPCDTKCD